MLQRRRPTTQSQSSAASVAADQAFADIFGVQPSTADATWPGDDLFEALTMVPAARRPRDSWVSRQTATSSSAPSAGTAAATASWSRRAEAVYSNVGGEKHISGRWYTETPQGKYAGKIKDTHVETIDVLPAAPGSAQPFEVRRAEYELDPSSIRPDVLFDLAAPKPVAALLGATSAPAVRSARLEREGMSVAEFLKANPSPPLTLESKATPPRRGPLIEPVEEETDKTAEDEKQSGVQPSGSANQLQVRVEMRYPGRANDVPRTAAFRPMMASDSYAKPWKKMAKFISENKLPRTISPKTPAPTTDKDICVYTVEISDSADPSQNRRIVTHSGLDDKLEKHVSKFVKQILAVAANE
jgi:hypothetical protein